MQAFIFGSGPTLSPVPDGVVVVDESLLIPPLGACGEDELGGVIEFAGGVDCATASVVAPSTTRAARTVVRVIINLSRIGSVQTVVWARTPITDVGMWTLRGREQVEGEVGAFWQ